MSPWRRQALPSFYCPGFTADHDPWRDRQGAARRGPPTGGHRGGGRCRPSRRCMVPSCSVRSPPPSPTLIVSCA